MQSLEKLKTITLGGGGRQTSAVHHFVLVFLGKSNSLEEHHLSRHGCRRDRLEERACPLSVLFSAWAAHGRTGFLKMHLPPPITVSLRVETTALIFFGLPTQRRAVLVAHSLWSRDLPPPQRRLVQVFTCAFLRISGIWNTGDFQWLRIC